MSRSIGDPAAEPDGRVYDARANTAAVASHRDGYLVIELKRANLSAVYTAAYSVGAGKVGYTNLIQVGSWLYQSPISYYAQPGPWDLSPGYESEDILDLDRPVLSGCLFCHAGSVRVKSGTQSQFEIGSLRAISCERCHGPVEQHLARPLPGSIINPAKLPQEVRDSVCEQCHLEGEVRVLGPGKDWWDFQAGQKLEDTLITYVRDRAKSGELRAVSQSEQLAESRCVRESRGALWCGSCHDPHGATQDRKAEIRRVCLSCHPATLGSQRHARTDDCVACHMPRLKAGNVPHTAITDHTIPRKPRGETANHDGRLQLRAWRRAIAAHAERDDGLAEFEAGAERHDWARMRQSYDLLVSYARKSPPDAPVLRALATILFNAGEGKRSIELFRKACALDPKNAEMAVLLATELEKEGDRPDAILELQTSIAIDPSFRKGYIQLAALYAREGEERLRRNTLAQYLEFMPQSIRFRLDSAPAAAP